MTIKEKLVWREVLIQRPYEMESLMDVLTGIAALTSRGPVIWEARCTGGRMRYLLGTRNWSVTRIQEVFKAHTKAQFVEAGERKTVSDARKLKISHPVLSLNTEVYAAVTRAVLAAMTGAKKDEECVVQLILGAAFSPHTVPKNAEDPTTSWVGAVLGRTVNLSPERRKVMKEKAEQYNFDATVRIGISGENTTTRVNNIISAIRTLEAAGVHVQMNRTKPEELNQALIPFKMPLRLSVKEASCFLFLPAGEEELEGVPGLHPKLLLPPKWYRSARSRIFAEGLDFSKKRLGISPQDALEHTVLLGPTGAGKSTAMLNLIMDDIRAGRSVLVIDPKADLVSDVLARMPEARQKDVVVIDPGDPAPVGFNPLNYRKDPAITADAVLAVFQDLFASNWGIRTADVLSAALQTLVRTKGANLLWLSPLLTDARFRQKIVSGIHDPLALEPFWERFEEMTRTERRTEIAPVLNKLRQISFRPGLRNVLGQSEPKFSLGELFYKRKVVLVPLNRGLIGAESARLLGSLIVGLTWTLALSRANVASEKRHVVSIFIDELQDYLSLPTSFSDALAQARGLGVAYTVAHQYRGQLTPDIKAGIDANCRNKIVFGLGAADAKDMATMAPELEPLDFMTLPRYQIYTNFHVHGKSTGWLSGKTLPKEDATVLPAEIKAASMKEYGVPAEQTEAELISVLGRHKPEANPSVMSAPIGRKKKKPPAE